MKFLYWNINNQSSPFEEHIKRLLEDNKIDVLILSENKQISDVTLIKDTEFIPVELKLKNKNSKWVQVFYRKNDDYLINHHNEHTEIDDENEDDINIEVNRIQVFRISGKIPETYFACIHFPSKLYHDEISQLQLVPVYKEKIHSLTQNSKRLFIVGDFNMNPFDYGMVEPTGFFAHNNRELITRDNRKKHLQNNIMYYNPSWTLLGDFVNTIEYKNGNRTGGSFYYEKEKSRCLYWHLVDQLIMRKSLINAFLSEDLEIIEEDEIVDEIKKDKIKGVNKIDHFPLKFAFNLKNKE